MAPVPKSYVNPSGASRGLINKKEENKGPSVRSNSRGLIGGQSNNRAGKNTYGIGAAKPNGANLNKNPPIINESGAAR